MSRARRAHERALARGPASSVATRACRSPRPPAVRRRGTAGVVCGKADLAVRPLAAERSPVGTAALPTTSPGKQEVLERSVGEHLAERCREGLRFAGGAVFAAEEAVVAAGEGDGFGAESFGHRDRRAAG